MPNISSLTMPDGIVYNIKDSQARKDVEEIKKQMSGGEATSSVLDDLLEGKSGVHLVSNAESVADMALMVSAHSDPLFGLGLLLESVKLLNATSIGTGAFGFCSALTTVNMPNVTSVGDGAFYTCSALTSIDMPNVMSIGNSAFDSCSALTSVYIGANCTSIGEFAFGSILKNAVINCGFAEGAVGGAPWGAPEGVTINYNVPYPVPEE